MSKFKAMFSKVKETLTKGVEKYDEATNKVEVMIMKRCGSDKTLDEAIDSGTDKAMDKVKTKVIPMVKCIPTKVKAVLPKKKVDPMTELAQDEELAAVLKWMHNNPCIKVHVQVIEEPVVPVVINNSTPIARIRINDNIAPMHGICSEPGFSPATISVMSKLNTFVRTATGAPMAVCVAPNN